MYVYVDSIPYRYDYRPLPVDSAVGNGALGYRPIGKPRPRREPRIAVTGYVNSGRARGNECKIKCMHDVLLH